MEKDEVFRVFCYWQHELKNVEKEGKRRKKSFSSFGEAWLEKLDEMILMNFKQKFLSEPA